MVKIFYIDDEKILYTQSTVVYKIEKILWAKTSKNLGCSDAQKVKRHVKNHFMGNINNLKKYSIKYTSQLWTQVISFFQRLFK